MQKASPLNLSTSEADFLMNHNNHSLAYRFHLPHSQDLLPLLEQPYITAAVLREMLRSRGTFINTQDKNLLISSIILTYLSPDEFNHLMSIAIDREEKRKVRNDYEQLHTSNNIRLSEALPDLNTVKFADLINEQIRNCSVDGVPNFVRKNENHYQIKYHIRRNNLHSNWLQSEQIFTSEIDIYVKPNEGVVQIENWHTSEETRISNRILTRHIIKSMSSKGLIDKDKSKTIRFNSFSNSQRIAFLMKFTSGFKNEIFRFEKLVDLSLRLDPKSKTSDKRLDWMKNKVSKLNLNGAALEDTFFVTDMDCRDDLLVWRFECLYKFENIEGKGSIRLALEFGGYSKSPKEPRINAPFQITLIRLSASKHRGSHEKLAKSIIKSLNEYQLEFFKNIQNPHCTENEASVVENNSMSH